MRLALGFVPDPVRALRRPWLDTVAADARGLALTGRIATRSDPAALRLVLRRFRDETHARTQTPLCDPAPRSALRHLAERVLGLSSYRFAVRFDIDWDRVAPGLYALELHGEDTRRRLQFRAQADALGIRSISETRTICAFIDPAVRITRIELHAIGPDALADLAAAAQAPLTGRPACIIGEYTNTARDNGAALFRAIKKSHPELDATYVIENPNLDGLPIGGGVVAWGSEAHLAACLQSTVCAFTHHRTYVYPAILRAIAPARHDATKTLFLQHGVMAMKGGNVVKHYHRARVDYDAVVVSSMRERNIFTRHFGYPAARVHITGLPRLDRLHDRAKSATPAPPCVLVAPTWRAGLEKLPSDRIADHPYFRQWRTALAALRDAGLKPVLIGHPILRRHVSLLGAEEEEIRANAVFQDTLLSASALVTDYSSTAWDALYVDRPVFLFHFDDDRAGFIPDSALPGPVATDAQTLARTVAAAHASGWPVTARVARDLAFDRVDANNTDRVVTLIRALAKDHSAAGVSATAPPAPLPAPLTRPRDR